MDCPLCSQKDMSFSTHQENNLFTYCLYTCKRCSAPLKKDPHENRFILILHDSNNNTHLFSYILYPNINQTDSITEQLVPLPLL